MKMYQYIFLNLSHLMHTVRYTCPIIFESAVFTKSQPDLDWEINNQKIFVINFCSTRLVICRLGITYIIDKNIV